MALLQSSQIPDLLSELPSPWGDAVSIAIEDVDVLTDAGVADLVIRVTWGSLSERFVAETRTRSIPRELERAVEQSIRHARATGLRPMVVVPHIGERQTEMLIDQGVSGLDLSGNGVIVVPDSILLCRTGQPNRFRESMAVRHAYRGSTSIVARVFLLEPVFRSVKQIGEEIAARGVRVAPSTVSKALTRLEEDVLIRRDERCITLVQPGELLDRLVRAYRPPRARREYMIRTELPIEEVFRRCPEDVRMSLTGAASMRKYATGARGDVTSVYCDRVARLRDALGSAWEETNRFPDLHVIETADKQLYFDRRRDSGGVTYASEVQAFIELASGDRRDRQMAEQIRDRLLDDVRRSSCTADSGGARRRGRDDTDHDRR